jgi:hypothetical protein
MSDEFWWFVGGIAATCVAQSLARNEKVQEGAYRASVATTVRGIQVRDAIQETAQDIKDGADDMYTDASAIAKEKQMIAQKRAEIERRVRAMVEAEMAEDEPRATSEESA